MQWVLGCPPDLLSCAALVADVHVGAGIVAQVPTGAIVGANQQAARLLGLTWDQLVGRSSMDPRWSAVSERGLPLTGSEHPAMVSLATGEPVAGFLMGVMTPVVMSDLGRTVARPRWIEISSHPARDDAGTVIGVVTHFVDASDTDRGRAASDTQWAALQLMIQNTEDVLLRTDPDGTVQWASVSADRVLGWSPTELVGRDLTDLVHVDDRAGLGELRSLIRSQESEESTESSEFRMATPEGGWRWVSDAARALRDGELRVAGEVHALRVIEAEVAAREALAVSEERFRLLAENSSDVVIHVRDGQVAWVSPSVLEVFGVEPSEWVGTRGDVLIHPDDTETTRQSVARLAEVESLVMRVRVRGGDDRYLWVDAHLRRYYGPDESIDGYIASLRVVDDIVRAEAELSRRARVDALTGLANRAEMMGLVTRLIGEDRRAGSEVALLFCDLDGFKAVNDEHGHHAGDEVLRVIGLRISGAIRKGDIAARIGGDEFLVVLFGIRGLDEALAVAEKVRAAAEVPIPLQSTVVAVSASVGVTLVRAGDTEDALVDRADAAMYEAKRSGRNRVVAH